MGARAIAIGEVISGKYRIERRLGAGAMGLVFAATHLELDERVALKFLNPRVRASADAKARFQREAKSMFTLRGEHVVRVLDVGRSDEDTPYIVMEFLEGGTLREHLMRGEAASLEERVALLVQACEGVAEAHARGIIHRDLKPENIFITRRTDGSFVAKVLDFGLSKAILGTHKDSLTAPGDLLGTPRYMAPEQFGRSADVDARSDVWALGVILYWLTTGVTPFDGDSPLTVMRAILEADVVAPSSIDPQIPVEIETIVFRCLARKKEERYADARALGKVLAPFSRSHGSDTIKMAVPTIAIDEKKSDAFADVDTIPNVRFEDRPVFEEATVPDRIAPTYDADAQRRTLKLDERALPSVMLGEGVNARRLTTKIPSKSPTLQKRIANLGANSVYVGVLAFVAAAVALLVLLRACK